MPGYAKWHNDEKTILLHIYEGNLTADDYYGVIDESFRLISEQPHPVHTVMIRGNITKQPPSFVPIMRYAERNLPPNQGIRFVMGATILTRVMVNIGKRITPKLAQNVYFVDSLQQAEAIIAKHKLKV